MILASNRKPNYFLMMDPRLTVSIPVGGVGVQEFLECILSLQEQEIDEPFLVNFYDDANTDPELIEVLDQLNSKSEYKVIHGKIKVGVSEARNILLNECNTDFCLFFDADDVLLPNAIKTFLEHSSEADVIQCDYRFTHHPYASSWYDYDVMKLRRRFFSNTRKFDFGAGHMFFRTEALKDKFKFDKNLKVAEDYVFMADILLGSNDVSYLKIPELLWHYRNEHKSGIPNLLKSPEAKDCEVAVRGIVCKKHLHLDLSSKTLRHMTWPNPINDPVVIKELKEFFDVIKKDDRFDYQFLREHFK